MVSIPIVFFGALLATVGAVIGYNSPPLSGGRASARSLHRTRSGTLAIWRAVGLLVVGLGVAVAVLGLSVF